MVRHAGRAGVVPLRLEEPERPRLLLDPDAVPEIDPAPVDGPGVAVAAIVGAQGPGAGLVIGGERGAVRERRPGLVAHGDALPERAEALAGEGEGAGIHDVIAAARHPTPVVPAPIESDGVDGVVVRVEAEWMPVVPRVAELHQVRPDVAPEWRPGDVGDVPRRAEDRKRTR